MKFLSNLYYRIVQWFVTQNIRFVEWQAARSLNQTNQLLRRVIILKNKNPDYVPPPPAPPQAREAEVVDLDFNKAPFVGPVGTTFGSEWVKHPELNPVIKSRKALQERAEQAKLDEALKAQAEAMAVAAVMSTEVPEEIVTSPTEWVLDELKPESETQVEDVNDTVKNLH